MRGGKREGSGRKLGGRNIAHKVAIDCAAQVLKEVDAPKIWKALVTCGDYKVTADVMKYLTDRVHGRPAQSVQLEGGKEPIRVVMEFIGR
jgi:hypothetical protein